jgi:hypothetical protein
MSVECCMRPASALKPALALLLGLTMTGVGTLILATQLHVDDASVVWLYRDCRPDERNPNTIYSVSRAEAFGWTSVSSEQGGGNYYCFAYPDEGEPERIVPGWAWDAIRPLRIDEQDADTFRTAVAIGWPLRCLWDSASAHELMFELPDWFYESVGIEYVMVPRRILWTGLTLNTVFYSALWWCMIVVPLHLCIMARQRRGGCARCGYDLRGLRETGCPECGAGRPHS